MSSGSSPISTWRRPSRWRASSGASTSAWTTSGDESTSPMPGDALVGVDADDQVVLAAVGDARRRRRLPQDDGLDLGDLHGSLLAGGMADDTAGRPQIVDYSEIVNNPLAWPGSHERLPDPLHDRPGSARESSSAGSRFRARRTRAAGRTSTSRSSRWRAARGPPHSCSAASTGRARGAGRRTQPRPRPAPEHVNGPRDRDPVRLDRRLPRLHAALAVGREHEPLVPGLARRPARRAARPLPLDRCSSRARTSSSTCTAAAAPGCACRGPRCTGSTIPAARADGRRDARTGTRDWCCVYIDIAGTGLLVGEAERQGKIVVSTELGGGGHVTAAIHRLAASGLGTFSAASACSRARSSRARARAAGAGAPDGDRARRTTCSRPSRGCSRRSSTWASGSRSTSRSGGSTSSSGPIASRR